MSGKRLGSFLLVGVLLLALTGCTSFGADVEGQLRPPQATGEQGRIEAALGEYIASTLTQENYVLKYPQNGAYRSAFVVEDLNGDGNDEALAFYRLGAENGTTHINLLHTSNGEWRSVSDHESSAAEIESVCFGDLDGDGVKELFLCWDMYSSHTYQLTMYSLKGNRISESFTNSCASVTVGDLTGDGRDNCLLFHMGAEQLTATLWAMKNNVMEELGRTVVDNAVQSLHTANVVPLTETQNGVFLDCAKSGDTLVTELLYWDGSRLVTPFYDGSADGNTQTARRSNIPSGDMDEDGVWEWPVCTLLSGYEQADDGSLTTTCWKTTFWSWDAASEQAVQKFSCIYNRADGYYLLLEEGMSRSVTTRYNEKTRALWLYPVSEEGEVGDALLAVRTTPHGSREEDDTTQHKFQTLFESDEAKYTVWYAQENTYSLNMETLRYMLTLV